jgi:hypothetical protein
MSAVVYVICALTSLSCALLLLRGYWQRGPRLLLWSSLCFFGLTVDNVILFIDLVVFPEINLLMLRNLSALAGLFLLIYGLTWDTK